MPKQIDVVGGAIIRGGLVYCVQRGPTGALPGMWEFPGGKVEPDEDHGQALAREMREELLCAVIVGQKITTTAYRYAFGTVRLATYYCTLDGGDPRRTEHVAELWARPDDMADLPWAPADVPAARLVAKRLQAKW